MIYYQPFFPLDDEVLHKMLRITSTKKDYAKKAARSKLIKEGLKITVFAGTEGVTCEEILSKLNKPTGTGNFVSSEEYQL